mgnify:CR=1 FL=1
MEKIHASKLLAGLVPAGKLTSDPEVALVTTDSREVKPGCIFVAFPGERFDGHDFAARALEQFGPLIINDISAGELDHGMFAVVAAHDAPYIAMHMKGDPKSMQSLTDYRRDIVTEVVDYLRRRVGEMERAGIRAERIVLDPGFGFAKTAGQNFELLAGLHRLCAEGYPVLAGLSRKSMIYRTLGTTPDEALPGTIALGWECLRQGASILRVHDVREAVDTVRLFEVFERCRG